MATRFMKHHEKQWDELQELSPKYKQSWEDYLRSIDLDEARVQNLISELSECTCCEAHQQNRPTNLCKLVASPKTESYTEMTKCDCTCRHTIRHLCRIFSP